MQSRTGILGGTFDPVHRGHIAVASDVRATLRLEEMRLIPCCRPVHRAPPELPAEQRLRMLQLALEGREALLVDDQEIRRGGFSYTIDTVLQLRQDAAANTLLFVVIGMDVFAGIERWYRWRDLLALSCLLVLARPGFLEPREGLSRQLWLARKGAADKARPGQIVIHHPPQVALSSSQIRAALHGGAAPEAFCCPPVAAYIRRQGLYGCRS